MKKHIKIHIGHHFYGSGNLGDDFILEGFISAIKGYNITLSCCSPYISESLISRFPKVSWLPYSAESRQTAVVNCDVWLGLGGSPFQNAVSEWFIEHLDTETSLCSKHGKPMFYLGIGGQDKLAYSDPRIKRIVEYASSMWVRDALTFKTLTDKNLKLNRIPKIYHSSDLAHLLFVSHLFPKPKQNRINVTLNFDTGDWSQIQHLTQGLRKTSATELFWLSQESRKLPGSEKWLFEQINHSEHRLWTVNSYDQNDKSLSHILTSWPSAEFTLTSRFHATLAAAWSGSKVVVLNINQKLESVAQELGIEAISCDSSMESIISAINRAEPVDKRILKSKAEIANQSVSDFLKLVTSNT